MSVKVGTTDVVKVVGLKSIAAYRSGLEINPNVTTKEAEEGLAEVLLAGIPTRITNKNLIDYIFVRSLEVALCFDWPMQIHTGFGDKDLDLRQANPLHLRNVLEDHRFLDCRIVLLHASYPFSREASYLASVYHQVYLDFGLAIPKLSVHGMISSVKELLELAPLEKVMFSTDGYAFPETFYLGAKRAREVVFSVLRDACNEGDLSVPEALEAVTDIFSGNAKMFYKIAGAVPSRHFSDTISKLDNHMNGTQKDLVLVRVLWVDASGQHRCRVVPKNRFNSIVKENGLGLTCASMGMSSAMDGPADETNLTGTREIRLIPDLSTRCKIPCYEFSIVQSRQDVTHVIANLQRQRLNGRCFATEYLEGNLDLLTMLLPGCDDSELALSYGAILRDCIRHQVAAKFILESDHFKIFFTCIQDPCFDIASDTAATFRDLLTRHKSTVAEFLSKNYDWFFKEYNSLLESTNYITRRNSIKLLGEVLLDRSNSSVMCRYVCSLDNMRIHMNLLRDSNKSIQVEAFQVFKLFPANQRKPPEIVNVLVANKSKLIRFFSDFSLAKEDEKFESDKAEVVKEIAALEPKVDHA